MAVKVTRNDLKKAFRNKANFDEFINDIIRKELNMRAVKMQILEYKVDIFGRIDVTISIQCPMCGEEKEVTMTLDQFNRWRNNDEHVQNIFPEKTSSEREVLVSGICSSCWDKMFS